ncbi:hypothetical protein GGX14DRAFT_669637 [Mycena pura]|uniref:Uncharacterized protein n=1 Tax=Mycena pura TaxID=153505 RepID=A0AAD6VSD9_9AGAR|nr:hypothetical protein GGX14DRAFT_669637 [Mycena pura]
MEIGKAAHSTTDDAESKAHLQAAANMRKAGERNLVIEEDLLNFSTERSARTYTCCMVSYGVDGWDPQKWLVCKTLSSTPTYTDSRNQFFRHCAQQICQCILGTSDVFLFASKAQSDVKRIFCRIGLAVADTTVRHALAALTRHALAALTQSREMNMPRETAATLIKKEPAYRINLDNSQKYQIVHEPGLGKKSGRTVS